MPQIEGRDRIRVVTESGNEIRVWNHATVTVSNYIDSVNGHETSEVRVSRGDDPHGPEPPFITKRLADVLCTEFGVDLDKRHMEVIDVQSGDVEVL